MHTTRQELLSSANRRARRAQRTMGRIVVSALGFGVAYYFDTENGGARRTQPCQLLQRTAGNLDSVLTSEVGVPPQVFHSAWRGIRAEGPASGAPESVGAGCPTGGHHPPQDHTRSLVNGELRAHSGWRRNADLSPPREVRPVT